MFSVLLFSIFFSMSLQWPAWLTRLAWLALYTHSTILSTYADDTQMFYAEDNVKDVEQAMNSDLSKID